MPDSTFNKSQLARLQEAMEYSYKKLKPIRKTQLESIKQYVGSHYSEGGSKKDVPVNFIELAMSIYLQHLAAQRPNVLVSTRPRELKPLALKLELSMNNTLDEMNFDDTIFDITMQAMFSMGIAKTGLNNTQSFKLDGKEYPLGETFVDSVSIDNWVQDMTTKSWNQMQFRGDRYTRLFDEVMEDPDFDSEFKDKLTKRESWTYTEDGDAKTQSVSQGNDALAKEYYDTVDLWDVYMPQQNVVLTMGDMDNNIVGKIIEWDGPDVGPYRTLVFNKVTDNTTPLPPVSTWLDLHELANGVMRKLGRQAQRQKSFTGVRGGAEADGNRVVNVNDGDVMKLDDPKNVKE